VAPAQARQRLDELLGADERYRLTFGGAQRAEQITGAEVH
jgi:hypothetical protein